uniref:Dymeclin n=1 Tax=Noccaea caerulescens TaxID=107243 RepID=A0A1J3GUI3_NOCCA
MGGVPSTPRNTGGDDVSVAEYLIATFVGEKSFPLASDFWNKLLELPLSSRWPSERVHQACELFAQSNGYTRHLAKLLIHLSWCLQELLQPSDAQSSIYKKAVNATYISSVFLKHLIENGKSDSLEELHLSLDESEPVPHGFVMDQDIQNFVMHSVLSFIGSTEVSPNSYVLHQELLNFMLVTMSTQLLSIPSSGPRDANPFIDAAMAQEKSLVCLAVRRLLLNYISRHRTPPNAKPYLYSDGDSPGILERVGSAAATFVLLPLNYLVKNSGDGSKNPLAECSLHVLLILTNYHKAIMSDESMTDKSDDSATSESVSKVHLFSSGNTFRKALANARDVEFDRSDVEGNANPGPHVRIPFASLFDTLGMCLADEGAVLLFYSLLQGNSDFKEYVLVRTDLDTMLMPILETLYNASRRTSSNQIYMMLIVLLILSQDSSFNSSVHKMILPNVPWYKEHLLHQTSLGSLMVIILIRTVQHNLSKLRDVYLQTTCLATLANMAPHAHHLSAYASQRLVSLFYMLSRKYNKLSDLTGEKLQSIKISLSEEDNGVSEDLAAELQIFTDFLRLVLDILNAILTYALPRNPEIVYAIMHRQEVFQPFKNHPRFHELVENIYTVLDFFNSRMDSERSDREWSVQKVLQFIINNCRSWRGEGMKMFTQLHFSYEQESHPEEFFIPYVWQLAFSRCGFSFNPDAIKLFPVPRQIEKQIGEEVDVKEKVQELSEQRIVFDP